ncbi:MAG: serine/threonine-protein phosphatase [Oscillatoriales cyanobacterium SM2_1_8]|nr:serine/threonine-protein phosphatase [Oscillatoriales cyanobacterium SM2_1_8]
MVPVFFGRSDRGCVRSSNQDSYYMDDPGGRFFVVADGMGGHAGGEEASRLAAETIRDYLQRHWDGGAPQALLQAAIEKANAAILADQLAHPVRRDSGTTVVVLGFFADGVWFAHIGDSRLYRLRAKDLTQISEDHTWIARAVSAGAVAPEEVRVHPWRHMLLQCLGREDLKPVEPVRIEFAPGDRLLMCSDGLTEELTGDRIAYHLANPNLQMAVNNLVDAAKAKGGRDNITVVAIAHPEIP